MIKKILVLFLALSMLFSLTVIVMAKDDYPSKPISWVVPFGTGGGSDQFARMMEKQIEEHTEAEIVVINIPGSKTAVGLNNLMQRDADGYTIFGATTDSIINLVTEVNKYDLSEIKPVAKVQHNVDMWFINSNDDRFSNYEELVAYAKEHPNELSIATTGLNGADSLTVRQIEEHENIEVENMPYSEPGERYAALAGGHVDILHEQPGDVMSFIDSGDYKPIIVMTEERVDGFEDVPTTLENDMDITAGYWRGIWVKEGTPEYAVDYLEEIIKKAVNTEEYKEYEKRKFLHLREGLLTGEEYQKFIEEEYKYYDSVMN
jgi:putative tricarboxylic transport membrane protein